MSKVLTSLPVGERVGIAFSGGLDTSVAVAWMRDKGAIPCTYTADIGQYDEPDIDSRARSRARSTAPSSSRLVDCKAALVDEGLAALACGAFHIRSGGRQYFNTTPLGRAVTGTLLVRAMHDDGVVHLGRRLDLQGQRHRAVLPLRAARQPEPAHLQAVAGRGLRRASSAAARRCRSGSPPTTCPTATASRRPTPPTPTSGAPPTRRRPSSTSTPRSRSSQPIMGVRFWDPAVAIETEDVTIRFAQGRPVAINGRAFGDAGRSRARGQRDRRPPRAGHGRPDREPHHRGQEPRHLRGAGHGAAVHRLRAPAQRDPQRGHHRQLPRGGPPPRPAAVRGPLARSAGPHAPRVAAALGRVRRHRRGHPAPAPR